MKSMSPRPEVSLRNRDGPMAHDQETTERNNQLISADIVAVVMV
jgi:hypothetical protein